MRHFMYFAAISLLLLCAGCKQKIGFNPAEAELITNKTDGIIAPSSQIVVRFGSAMVDGSNVGIALTERVFDFDPKIDGVVKWTDPYTLSLIPNQDLVAREHYEGALDLKKLLPSAANLPLDKIAIVFDVAGAEVVSSNVSFEPVDENNPDLVRIKGTIVFNFSVDEAKLKNAMEISRKGLFGKKLAFSLKAIDKNAFSFETDGIIRGKNADEYILKIDDSPIELAEDFERIVTLYPLSEFVVTEVTNISARDEPAFNICFSHDLDPARDYSGFVNCDPPVENLTIKVNQNSLIVRGKFDLGAQYQLTVRAGMKNHWGVAFANDQAFTASIPHMEPRIMFTHRGTFLPSSNKSTVTFTTVNLRKVHLTVKKVYANNVAYFLQDNDYKSAKSNRASGYDNEYGYDDGYYGDYYYDNTFSRVGKVVLETELEIGDEPDKVLQSALDLKKLIPKNEQGIFIIELRAQKDYVFAYQFENGEDWEITNFLGRNASVDKTIVLSDIGIYYKVAGKKHIVYCTDLVSGKPLSGASVKLITFQNQVVTKGKTDGSGKIELEGDEVFFVEAEKDGQRTMLKVASSNLSTSLFDVGGNSLSDKGLRAFIYTDRGVYRPGDSIYLSLILRNQDNTFPQNHPVTLNLKNPQDKTLVTKTSKTAVDGYYSFALVTDENALTGNWRAEISAGNEVFSHTIKVETIVPYRLKVKLEPQVERLDANSKSVDIKVTSQYLFGSPAANLDCEGDYSLVPRNLNVKKYPRMSFENEAFTANQMTEPTISKKLSTSGEITFNWNLPKTLAEANNPYSVQFNCRVFEKGGRFVPATVSIPLDVHEYYVGVEKPVNRYFNQNSKVNFRAMIVDKNGKNVEGRIINYRVYQNRSHWWYDYNQRNNKASYKSMVGTTLITSGTVKTGSEPVAIAFEVEKDGQILVELQDGDAGHVSGFFMYSFGWSSDDTKDACVLPIALNKEKFNIGDTVIVKISPVPKGNALLTVEKGYDILISKWQTVDKDTLVFRFAATAEMLPNAYAFVTVLQPHEQTTNDRPMRMYAVAPVMVEDHKTKFNLTISAPTEIKPNSDFEVSVKASGVSNSKKPTQLTIAVVDEGLLDITNFATPSPWDFFFAKQALMFQTYDVYSDVIGANWGEIFKKFSIGGDFAEYSAKHGQSKVRRFKPVAMFSGVLTVDKSGVAKAKFHMPNYFGSVRVMVVGANENCYANAEKTIQVKSPLIVLSSLPRVMGPADNIYVPVSIFATKDGIGKTKVSISVDGVGSILGKKDTTVDMSKESETDVMFTLAADEAVGNMKVKITAANGANKAEEITELEVRASNPRVFDFKEIGVEAGKTAQLTLPTAGMEGTRKSRIVISRFANANFTGRMKGLIEYPYGCVEQTTSAAFPQLYLPDVFKLSTDERKRVDDNINAAIGRLRSFLMPNGKLSYWPNGNYHSNWGTSYAYHFLVEAKNKGYFVPDDLLRAISNSENTSATAAEGMFSERTYRLYVLALDKKPNLGAMNLLRQSALAKLSNAEKMHLAAAYKLAGSDAVAGEIFSKTDTLVDDNESYYYYSYGSNIRSKAIMLECLLLFENMTKAQFIYRDISEQLASNRWYSTQTAAYSLTALGKYIRKVKAGGTFGAELIKPSGEHVKIDSSATAVYIDVSDYGQTYSIVNKGNTPIFASYEHSSIPLREGVTTSNNVLSLNVEWLNADGTQINLADIAQGEIFWGHFKVSKPQNYEQISNIALVQLLPAGWEIINTRLSWDALPDWSIHYVLEREQYMDIRDDRICWFFTFNEYESHFDFLVKLNAVTPGHYFLPPTIVEAMYDEKIGAKVAGMPVKVTLSR